MVVKKLMTLEKMMVSSLNKINDVDFLFLFCQYLQWNLNNHASKGVLVEQDEGWRSEWFEMAVTFLNRVLRWGCRWHLLHANQIILKIMTMMMTIRECDIAAHQIILRSMTMMTIWECDNKLIESFSEVLLWWWRSESVISLLIKSFSEVWLWWWRSYFLTLRWSTAEWWSQIMGGPQCHPSPTLDDQKSVHIPHVSKTYF